MPPSPVRLELALEPELPTPLLEPEPPLDPESVLVPELPLDPAPVPVEPD
jgi:hypothetical protein